MSQCDNHPDPMTKPGRKDRQELAPNQSTVPMGLSEGRATAGQYTGTHNFPPCSTWLSTEALDMHCTVDDHRRHLMKKASSPSSSRRARSESSIRQCGPSTTAR